MKKKILVITIIVVCVGLLGGLVLQAGEDAVKDQDMKQESVKEMVQGEVENCSDNAVKEELKNGEDAASTQEQVKDKVGEDSESEAVKDQIKEQIKDQTEEE